MKKIPTIDSKKFKMWMEYFKIEYPVDYATFDTKNLYDIYKVGF